MSARRGGKRITAFEYHPDLAAALETLKYQARVLAPHNNSISERRAPTLLLVLDLDARKRIALAMLVQDVTEHELRRDRFLLVTKRYRDLYLRNVITLRNKRLFDQRALHYGQGKLTSREYALAGRVLNIDFQHRMARLYPDDSWQREGLTATIALAVKELKLDPA